MRKPASFYFFESKPIVLKNRCECWKEVAELLGLTARERLIVQWMVFQYAAGKGNAALTAQYFGISRKTFYKWSKRCRDRKYDAHSLADSSRAPRRKRQWKVDRHPGRQDKTLEKEISLLWQEEPGGHL